jgi:hypothetical protein
MLLRAPNAQEGYTPLIAASSAGKLECVQLLLDHGADVNIADPVISTPIAAHIPMLMTERCTERSDGIACCS